MNTHFNETIGGICQSLVGTDKEGPSKLRIVLQVEKDLAYKKNFINQLMKKQH
jgi:hypothetical protein